MEHNTTAYVNGTVRCRTDCATLSASAAARTPVAVHQPNTVIVPVHLRRRLEEKDVD